MLEVAVAEGVVHDTAGALGILGRRADDVDHRDVLGVTAGNGIGRRQFADAEGGDQGGHTPQPAVAVGGVTGVELVGAADPVDLRVSQDVVEKLQLIVAGNAEDLGHPEFGEPVQ